MPFLLSCFVYVAPWNLLPERNFTGPLFTVTLCGARPAKFQRTVVPFETVTVKSGPVKFRSGNKLHGATYTKKLSKKGTYRIYCSIHGAQDQSMKLVVR